MIKKYSKLLLVFLCAFFIAMTPSFAREMDLNELNDLVDETLDYSDDVSGIYIIGEYAFTSEWVLTTQDTMLAARSIKAVSTGKTNKDGIYGEMTIHSYTRTTDSKYNYNGFSKDPNLVGLTPTEDKVNIKYIDYIFIPDASKATITKDETNSEIDLVDGKLTGLIKKTNGADGEGYYYTFTVDINEFEPNVSTVNGEAVAVSPTTVTVKLDPNATNKTVTIVVDQDGADSVEYGPTNYKIDYSELVFEKETEVTVKLFDEKDAAYADAAKSLKDVHNFNGNVGKLTLTDGKLTGSISPIEGIKGFAKDGEYYFAYVISAPEGMTKKDLADVKVVVPADGGVREVGIEAFDTDNSIVVIFQLDPEAENKEFEVKVDFDGDGKEYTPATVKFDYSELVFSKRTNATVSANLPTADATELGTLFDFVANDANVKLDKGKLTGIISTGIANDEKFSSDVADRTGYYYAFNVEVEGANDATTIEINGKKVTSYTGRDSLTTLFALDPNATNKVITIKVDRDGSGDEYTTEVYTIDYSELVFADVLLEKADQNLNELDDAKSVLTFTAIAKEEANNANLVVELSYDSKSQTTKRLVTGMQNEETIKSYMYSRVVNDILEEYTSDDNTSWTKKNYNITSDTGKNPSTLLGTPDSVKVTNVAEDGTVTMDVLLVKAGEEINVGEIVGLPSEDVNAIITVDKDVHVIVEIKDEMVVKMSANLLDSFADEAKDDFSKIDFVVEVSKLTESIVIPEDVIKNAVVK